MQEGALPREYRHGRSGSALVWVALGGGAVTLLVPLWTSSFPGQVKVLGTGLVLVLGGWALAARRRQFTRVDLKGISRANGLRSRRLAWNDLHDIRTMAVPQGGPGPTTVTYAYRTDGSRLLLPCVDDVELPAVEQEVLVLRSLLVELRGTDWTPDPRAGRRIAGQEARWEAISRWSSGWRLFLVSGGITVVILAGIVGGALLFGSP
ncbi:hypothetical protein ACIGFK_29320 [Streptomyces sp. NPDC085524]|uniref:hypothetical protein n=1 Tax=unclassified Streptomyces TaxID=2593676 RepID=UPI0035DAD1BF